MNLCDNQIFWVASASFVVIEFGLLYLTIRIHPLIRLHLPEFPLAAVAEGG